MRRRRLLAGLMFVAVAVASFAGGAAVVVASSVPEHATYSRAGAQTGAVTCRSPALGGSLPAMVYLPAGYKGGTARYPVVYFLHGLPANPTSYQANSFVAASVPSGHQAAIVVSPQGARSANSDREYLDWSATENWPRAISHDLTTCIDRRYRTIRRRAGRALVGLSAGGYGAFNVGLRALDTFGAVESWSGYFAATDPVGDKVLELGSKQADDDARAPSGPGLAAALKHYPSLLAFYIGNQDSRFLTTNRQYDGALKASHVAHVFKVYSGGHTMVLWSGEATRWLSMALTALVAERRGKVHTSAGLESGVSGGSGL
ncbi:MAG: alpha/beta hydrolase-fold protein [Solirubrobacteraceae bacterium]